MGRGDRCCYCNRLVTNGGRVGWEFEVIEREHGGVVGFLVWLIVVMGFLSAYACFLILDSNSMLSREAPFAGYESVDSLRQD